MIRRRFYAPPEAFSPDRKSARLSGDETRHLRNVLRLKAGDEIYLFDGAGQEFHCHVEAITREAAEVKLVEQVEPAQPESSLNLMLGIALLKGEKFDLAIQKATELGVTQIIPLITSRADVRVKSHDDAERKTARWQRIVLEATKQCGRARLMKIETPMLFADLMRGGKASGSEAEIASEDVCAPVKDIFRLMFAERGGDSFAGVLSHNQTKPENVITLVGPEGGWADEEIDWASGAGWKIVTLGGRILRAETAAIVIAALMQHRFGDLK